MWYGSKLDRFASALVVLSVGVLASGTNACQEDYQFAAQSTVTPSVTETPTGSPTGEGTGTATAVPTGTQTVTAAPTETDDGGDEDTDVATGDGDLFQELSALGAKNESAAGAAGVVSGAKINNWLGEAFTKDDGSWQDSDADGFSDSLEKDAESDPQSAGATPGDVGTTRLDDRISSQDVELETRRLAEESKGDGEEGIADTDLDGVPDDVEKQRGMNSSAADSDTDGLRDDREIVLGTNPLRADSDGDGISDNREYLAGLDPTIPENKKSAS